MSEPKQLIVAVEGTAAVGPFWHTIFSDYLQKIIRSFCGNEPTGQKSSSQRAELSLVIFNTHDSYSACLVQRSGWTKDMDTFLQWLSAISFSGGGFSDSAIAEGLAEALMMLSTPNATQNPNMDVQRHCILVAASNPYPLPTPVYRPQPPNTEQSDNTELQPENRLFNAETLAKSFAQCGISLSVICPKQLPKLRSIYNSGKSNPRATDPPVDNVKNPHFHVLVSENFMEGRAALSRSGVANMPPTQSTFKMDVPPAPPVSTPLPAAVPSANGSVLGRLPLPVGNILPATVKVEPTTVTAPTGPAFPHVSSIPRPSQPVPALQATSPLSTPQEMIPNNENTPEMKPLVNNMTPSLRPVGGAAANVRILNDVAQARQALAGGTSMGLSSMGGSPMLSNMISSGMGSTVPPSQTVMSSGQSGITSVSTASMTIPSTAASFTSAAAPNAAVNPSLGMSQPSNLQGNVGVVQTGMGMSQGNPPVTQIMQTGMGMNQSMLNGNSGASSGIPSGSGTIIPTPGMSQQPGMQQQPVGMNVNNSLSMPLNPQSSNVLQTAQSKYIKVWEGNLSGQRQGQPVFITRLEGYRNASASETLAANWPATMQIVRLISQDHMNNKQYVGKADFLVFRAMNQHGFLGQLQEKKLCAVIQLPSQTLLLSVSDKAYRLIGMLFPGMEGSTFKRSRVEGGAVTRSERSRRRPGRVVEEEYASSPPPIQHFMTTPDMSGASSSSSHCMYGSNYYEFEIPSSYDEERNETVNDGGPALDDLIPSYKSHVAHFIWNEEDRGILKLHDRINTVKTWKVMQGDAAALIETSGLGGLADVMYDALDTPLICAFIERWYPETNTFHMPFGEMTITLHDTQFILGLPVMGEPICPPCDGNPMDTLMALGNALGIPNQTELKLTTGWVGSSAKQSSMRLLTMGAYTQPSKLAMIHLWWVLTSTLFVDKSKTHGHASFIELLRKPGEAKKYAWGAGTLANLYRELGIASRAGCMQVGGCLTLLQAWIYAYFPLLRPQARQSWMQDQPCAAMWIPNTGKSGGTEHALLEHRNYLDSLTVESIEWLPFGAHPGQRIPISCFRGIIHCRSINEPYMPDRVARQFGYVQTIPSDPIEPTSCNRGSNPNVYVVKHDPAYWVFRGGDKYHTFDTIELAGVGYACEQTYMDWYLLRTHPRVSRVDDEENDEEEQLYVPNSFGVLQQIADIAAPYHRSVYDGTSDVDQAMMDIANLIGLLMSNMRIGRPNITFR